MPPVVAPDADADTSPPELATELIVWSNCSTFAAPVFWICSRVMIWTGKAVSASIRLIDEPVTSTRCNCTVWSGGVVCASAVVLKTTADPLKATSRLLASTVLLSIGDSW